jgi:nitrogen regulatory protein PII
MLTITDRALAEDYARVFRRHDVSAVLIALGTGTAKQETLDLFGLEENEKAVLLSFTATHHLPRLVKSLRHHLKIGMPGRGILLTIPLRSIGGDTAARLLIEHLHTERTEETMPEEMPFELIIAVANEGYVDLVVDAAQKAQATGATIVHARGVGSHEMRKFFGFNISDEKELVFIVCRRDCRNRIMKAIMADAGQKTKAKSIVFSLPVSSAEGLWILERDKEQEDEEIVE